MKIVAVILAGGSGNRSGFARPKQLAKLAGRPLIAHTLERFQIHPEVDEIAIVTSSNCESDIEVIVNRERFSKVKRILLGGKERHESSLSAIRAYDDEAQKGDVSLLFHDAVRPLVSQQIISEVIEALKHYGAVDTAVVSPDTVVLTNPVTSTIREIPDRALIRLGQTPQGFHHKVIKKAYESALLDTQFRTTDDCGVVLRYSPGEKIFIVPGASTNLKLTFPEDLMIIDKFMQSGAGRRLNAASASISLAKLRSKTIVVFGGSSGIGRSMCELATEYGANVVVASRSSGVDISDAGQVAQALKDANSISGNIDAVVNTAALLTRQPLSTMSPSEITESINTNILGCFNVARMSYDYLSKTSGHLLLFSSSSYTYGRAFYSTYSASKAAVVNLTQALADEWSESGIKVNCVNPERSRTPMRTKAFGIEPEDTLLDPEEVGRKALNILVSDTTGLIFDIIKR